MVRQAKKLLVFILLWAINSFSGENIFQKAVEYYKEGNYLEAIKEWKKLEEDYNDWRIYYNIGNAYAKLNNMGFAMVYYERALKINPKEKRIKENINYLKIKLKDKILEEPKSPLRNTLEEIYNNLNFNIVFNSFLIIFILLNVLIFLNLLILEKIPKSSVIIFSFMIALLILMGIFLIHYWQKEKIMYGILIEPAISVKSEPLEDATELFVIHEGIKVKIFEEIESWYRIGIPNGMSGFIPKKVIEVI